MEIPDNLRCIFTASIEADSNATYTIEIPKQEIEMGTLQPGAIYRLALLAPGDAALQTDTDTTNVSDSAPDSEESGPPVDEGEIRTVDIDDIGDQGDGIARVEHGYVIIVPDTEQGERVKIAITTVRDNVAFGEVEERLTSPRQSQPE